MRANYAYKAFRDQDRRVLNWSSPAKLFRARPSSTPLLLPSIVVKGAGLSRLEIRSVASSRPAQFPLRGGNGIHLPGIAVFDESAHMFERALSVIPTDHFARAQLAQIPFFEYADVQTWRTKLSAIINEDPKAATEIANDLVYCALAGRDSALATRALQSIRAEGLPDSYNNSLWARDWFVGLAARTFGDEAKAHAAFTSARAIEEKSCTTNPITRRPGVDSDSSMPASDTRKMRSAKGAARVNCCQSPRMQWTALPTSSISPRSMPGLARKIWRSNNSPSPQKFQPALLTANSSSTHNGIRFAAIRASKNRSFASRRD